jgi:hypothetical protein
MVHSLGRKKWPRLTRAFRNTLNQGIFDSHGNPAPMPHSVYVNYDIYLDVADKHRFEQAIAASIEAIFMLLGDSNMALRQDPISWDKLHKLLVAPVNQILGLVLNLRQMTVGTLQDFVTSTINLLRTTWGPHRRFFKVKEAEELTGKLNHITSGPPWLKYLLGNIYSLLATALHLNKFHLIRMSPRFREALRKIRTATAAADGDAKRAFYTGTTARSVHGSNTLQHISIDLHHNLCLIERMLSSPHCPMSCPISYLIPRMPIGTAHSDSSLTAAGGYCPKAAFWWYLKWPEPIQACTLCHVKARNNPLLGSINSLEYSAQLITMMGCHLSHLETKD